MNRSSNSMRWCKQQQTGIWENWAVLNIYIIDYYIVELLASLCPVNYVFPYIIWGNGLDYFKAFQLCMLTLDIWRAISPILGQSFHLYSKFHLPQGVWLLSLLTLPTPLSLLFLSELQKHSSFLPFPLKLNCRNPLVQWFSSFCVYKNYLS